MVGVHILYYAKVRSQLNELITQIYFLIPDPVSKQNFTYSAYNHAQNHLV